MAHFPGLVSNKYLDLHCSISYCAL